MRQALTAFLLFALVAPLFPVPALSQEISEPLETPQELATNEATEKVLDPLQITEEGSVSPEENQEEGNLLTEGQNSETATAPEHNENPFEAQDDARAVSETPSSFSGIGQTIGDAVSDLGGGWFLGQTGITVSFPGRVQHIAVYPDIEDPDFINCADSIAGQGTLGIWMGRDGTPLEAKTFFRSTHSEPRSDGSCVYKNDEGVFVFPNTAFQFVLNNVFASDVRFEYWGSQDTVSETLGRTRISNSNVPIQNLNWHRDSRTVQALKFTLSIGDEPPPTYGVPQSIPYTLPAPPKTIAELAAHEILGDGLHETPLGFGYPFSSAYVNAPAYFKKTGTIGFIRTTLSYFYPNPDAPVYFKIANRDCRTPERRLFEWGIRDDGRNVYGSEVVIGPFTGSECAYDALDPLRPQETAVAIDAISNERRIGFGAGDNGNNLIDITLYSAEATVPPLSSVLFLPGIKGTRLYMAKDSCDFFFFDCDEEPLWPPAGDRDVRDLFLTPSGTSVNKVYAKKDSLLDSYLSLDFYASFISEMEALETANTISEFSAVPYDWRLSLHNIVNNGSVKDSIIDYGATTSTPYIEQELRRLAKESKTGKVTIVAHSNGGLVAKALMQKIGESETARIIDNVIFVGVPQSGAPQALGALLFGYGESMPTDTCADNFIYGFLCSFLVERGVAREMAENSPMAYHLLPSEAYFQSITDPDHPVARFTGTHAYADEYVMYGDTLDSFSELKKYLRAEDGGRTKPAPDNVKDANILNEELITYAETVHQSLDSWRPPASVTVHQVAGWGVDTVSGIEFTEYNGPFTKWLPLYRPIFVEDGDKVVPAPSALLIPASANVKNYWVDFLKMRNLSSFKPEHANILAVPEVQNFIEGTLHGEERLSVFVLLNQPDTNNPTKKLRFILHAEAALKVEDSSGNTTTYSDEVITNTIPEADYGEFGGVKYVTVPDTGTYEVKVEKAKKPERATLEIERVEKGKTKKRTTVAHIPVTESSTITFAIPETEEEPEPIQIIIDENADGVPETEETVEDGETVVFTEPIVEIPTDKEDSGSASRKQTLVAVETDAPQIEEAPVIANDTETEFSTFPVPLLEEVLGESTTTEEVASSSPETPEKSIDIPQTSPLTQFFSWLSHTFSSVLSFFYNLFT